MRYFLFFLFVLIFLFLNSVTASFKSFPLSVPIRSQPIVYSKHIYGFFLPHSFVKLTATGERVWTINLDKDQVTDLQIAFDCLVVLSQTNQCTVYSLLDGAKLWQTQCDSVKKLEVGYPFIVVLTDKNINAFDLFTGQLVWSNEGVFQDLYVNFSNKTFWVRDKNKLKSGSLLEGIVSHTYTLHAKFDDKVLFYNGDYLHTQKNVFNTLWSLEGTPEKKETFEGEFKRVGNTLLKINSAQVFVYKNNTWDSLFIYDSDETLFFQDAYIGILRLNQKKMRLINLGTRDVAFYDLSPLKGAFKGFLPFGNGNIVAIAENNLVFLQKEKL